MEKDAACAPEPMQRLWGRRSFLDPEGIRTPNRRMLDNIKIEEYGGSDVTVVRLGGHGVELCSAVIGVEFLSR
jgi:hypothetical protein